MSARCQTCWNLTQCCTCPIPADECRFHHERGTKHDPCTCGPSLVWWCHYCQTLNALGEHAEWGYICASCLRDAELDEMMHPVFSARLERLAQIRGAMP